MTDDLLRDLAKEIPYDRPDPARRDALRSALLVEAAEGARPDARRRWIVVGGAFAAGVLAAAAVALVVGRGGGDHPTLQSTNPAQITASSEARLEHHVVATDTGVDEIVRVHDGKVKLAVADVRRGDRVRVRTRDAEVEGAGVYEVVVDDEILSAVSVRSGTAEIKVTGQRTVMLAAGQTWRASIITTDLSPASPTVALADTAVPKVDAPKDVAKRSVANPSVPTTHVPNTDAARRPVPNVDAAKPTAAGSEVELPRAPASIPEAAQPGASKRQVSAIEQRFQAGWALLKAGKAREAAHELGGAADTAPQDPLAADARYFQAVALVRAGERTEAERVLVTFLDSAPRSLRRGRAAVLLGRLIGERGDRANARVWLESAVTDPDPAIAAAAKAGLQALDKR